MLGACAAGTGVPALPGPSGPSAAVTSTAPSPSLSQAAGTVVTSGHVRLVVFAAGARAGEPPVRVVPDAASATTEIVLAVGGAAGHGWPEMRLASGGSLVRHADGSVTVLDDGGTPVAGLSRPGGDVTFELVDDQTVRVLGTAGSAESRAPRETATTLGTAAVAATRWGEREGGRSLAVEPTGWARSAGEAGWTLAWAELVAADPSLDAQTMHDQLVCHAIGAPDKATWNLEPWRPDVGLLGVMAARCNPAP